MKKRKELKRGCDKLKQLQLPHAEFQKELPNFFSRDFWITAERDIVRPHQMSDKHLINTIKFIRKRVNKFKTFLAMIKRDSNLLNTPDDEFLIKHLKIYRLLIKEAKRRGYNFNYKNITINKGLINIL